MKTRIVVLPAIITIFLCFSSVLANGTIDSIYGNNGFAVADFGLPSQAKEMVLQANGKVIIAGEVKNSFDPDASHRDIGVARFNSDGSIDTSFGSNGKVVTNVQNKSVFVSKAIVQPDGKILVIGTQRQNCCFYSGVIARYNLDGSLDNNFGANGILLFNRFGGREEFLSAALQADGKIVVVGDREIQDSLFPYYRDIPMLARFDSKGAIDQSFGENGVALTDFFRQQIRTMSYNAVAIQPDGKIIAAGGGEILLPDLSGTSRGGVVRLNSDGRLDATFARRGLQRLYTETISDIKLLDNGKILTAGAKVRRFLNDGSFDDSFYVPNTFQSNYGGLKLDIRSDGKIAVVNPSSTGSNSDIAGLIRKDGGLIGFTTTNDTISGYTFDVSFQPDGKVLYACSRYNDTAFRIVRYHTITSLARGVTHFTTTDRSRIGVYRPNVGIWYLLDGTQEGLDGIQFGKAGDFVVPGDYDGDGRSDVAVWGRNQASGAMEFCYKTSYPPVQTKCVQWGSSGDIPVAGDYDGDTVADFTVFRQGAWWTLRNSDLTPQVVNFGMSGDVPTPSDFDGDGITDQAIYRPSNGTWWVRQSSTGNAVSVQFGNAADKPVVGDYDGDGRADFAVYRASEGNWYLLQSSAGFRVVRFGSNQDKPVPGDYDGDGRTDIAVFRPSEGNWYLQQSRDGFLAVQWGSQSDIPLSAHYSNSTD